MMANELPRRWAAYAHQEFMTPGVEETLEIVADYGGLNKASRVLDVACGKGEAACRLAQRFGCRVVGIDSHAATDYAVANARARRLAETVSFVRADMEALPIRRGCFDVVLCTGGPSMVGTTKCMQQIGAALRPGGLAIVSDWVWRSRPVPPEAISRGDAKETKFILLDEYAHEVREAGFEVILAQTLPPYVWYGYYAPMLEVIEEWRHSGDPELQARAESSWSNELKTFLEGAGRDYWGYAVFVARKLG